MRANYLFVVKNIEIWEPAFSSRLFIYSYRGLGFSGFEMHHMVYIILTFISNFWLFLFDFQCNLGQAGELSIWEFSGVESYHMVYDHFIGNTNCIHTVVFNVEDKPEVQLAQVRYWLHFLQSRVPPVEPLGKYLLNSDRKWIRQP